MILTFIKYLYRILATIVVSMPIILNILNPSDILNSLLYTPLLSLGLAIFFAYFDNQIIIFLELLNNYLTLCNKCLMKKYPTLIKDE